MYKIKFFVCFFFVFLVKLLANIHLLSPSCTKQAHEFTQDQTFYTQVLQHSSIQHTELQESHSKEREHIYKFKEHLDWICKGWTVS